MSFSWKSNSITSLSSNIPTIALPLPAFKGGSGLSNSNLASKDSSLLLNLQMSSHLIGY